MACLIAGGDSYIWGNELSDDTGDPSKHSVLTWPALLAKDLHFDYKCVAQYGGANTAIARHVMNTCEKFKNTTNVKVIVQWTFCSRYEFRMTYDTKSQDSPWYSISNWTILEDSTTIKDSFHNSNDEVFQHHINHLENAHKTGISEFAKAFITHVGNSEYYEIYSSLKEIVFLQNYLKTNNIDYLFTASNSDFFNNDLYTLANPDDTITTLVNQIDWKFWFKFPGKTRSVGFYRWAIENNCPLGATHPLDDAHQLAYNLIKDELQWHA